MQAMRVATFCLFVNSISYKWAVKLNVLQPVFLKQIAVAHRNL